MAKIQLSRGSVWFCDLNPRQGKAIDKVRPVVIVSADDFNDATDYPWVVPVTSTLRSDPMHVFLKAPEGGLRNDGMALVEQFRSVDVQRLHDGLGHIRPNTLYAILERIRIAMDFSLKIGEPTQRRQPIADPCESQ